MQIQTHACISARIHAHPDTYTPVCFGSFTSNQAEANLLSQYLWRHNNTCAFTSRNCMLCHHNYDLYESTRWLFVASFENRDENINDNKYGENAFFFFSFHFFSSFFPCFLLLYIRLIINMMKMHIYICFLFFFLFFFLLFPFLSFFIYIRFIFEIYLQYLSLHLRRQVYESSLIRNEKRCEIWGRWKLWKTWIKCISPLFHES